MTVRFEVHGQVARIVLDRPRKKNAIDADMARGLHAAFDRLETTAELRVGVLAAEYGDGRAVFCAGHDLTHFLETFGTDEEDAVTTAEGFAGLTRRQRSKPLIAAVDGLATSGGFEMALACDIIIASTRAAFALAEVKWNLCPSAGGALRLPRAVGRIVAMDALLTGSEIPAERAFQLGLVSRLTQAGQASEVAMQVAQDICRNGPRAVQLTRAIAARAESIGDAEGWAMLDEAAGTLRDSQDLLEGLQAFRERRAPQWRGE
ncbi:MAG TPA: enoyl-CoA hydratase-related protein [Ramlibacter sp.]|nr:enoyl-CoA hydratase-related protein [Ramlibacter sp.]